MATLRLRTRKDGSANTSVLFRVNGKQSSPSFDDHAKAVRFKDLVNQVSPTKAIEVVAATERTGLVLTVEEWIGHHIDHLTGVEPETIRRYRSYLVNDIAPALGAKPLTGLSSDDIALWVNAMFDPVWTDYAKVDWTHRYRLLVATHRVAVQVIDRGRGVVIYNSVVSSGPQGELAMSSRSR